MNVLSVFDGLSCGRIALDRSGISVKTYYASEIDRHAIAVSKSNYPDIIQMGDVTKWRDWGLNWSKIDLLIGGSPCQGFSFAGKQLNFGDVRSKLFFVYAEILSHIKKSNPDVRFLLENVRMKKDSLDVISRMLGVSPIMINSSLVSAQNRQRNYWANWCIIPPNDTGKTGGDFDGAPCNKDRKLQHTITAKSSYGSLDLRGFYLGNSTSQRIYGLRGKLPTLLTNNTGGNNPLWITEDGANAYQASINFCEFLQNVPKDYTINAPSNQRYRMLGNGWTINVISHIFSNMPPKPQPKQEAMDL